MALNLFNKLYFNSEKEFEPLYFNNQLTTWFTQVRRNVNDLVLLDRALNREFWYVEKLDPESEEFQDFSVISAPPILFGNFRKWAQPRF